jgi:hypothetical protein
MTTSKKRKTAKLATNKPAAKTADRPRPVLAVQQFNPEHKIHVLAKENPKRKGSKEAKRFSLYKNGMTVQAAKEAGMDNMNFTRDVQLGYIKVGAA